MIRIVSKILKPRKSYFLLFLAVLILATGCYRSKVPPKAEPMGRMRVETPMPTPFIGQVEETQLPPVISPQNQEKIKVALLLPLSGKSQKLGEAMLDAAQLAASDIANNSLVIVPIDTADNQLSALQAVNRAIDEKVSIILGPLYSNATSIIAPVATQAGLNVISFSNDKSLMQEGVFLLGFMPDQQIKRVVNYAIDKGGITNLSSFVPNNDLGKIVTSELNQISSARNVRMESVGSYTPAENEEQVDLTKAIQVRSESTGAIVIPEGGNRLQNIISVMEKNTIDKQRVKYLGSGQWDDPLVLSIRPAYGGWFASSPPSKRRQFEDRFQQIYDYTPARISSLAYDAIALTAYLAQAKPGGDFSSEAITNPRGFAALNGIFRFNNEGICERGLSVIEVKSTGFAEIDPAPASFSNY